MADQRIPDYIQFQKQNPKDRKKLLDNIFPEGLPLRASWYKSTDIQDILTRLGTLEGVHYTFLPSGGGLDLHGAQANGTTGLSELQLGSMVWIGKTKELSFESFGDRTHNLWCYFRLELDNLLPRHESPIGREGYYQYLTEITPGKYLSDSAWDNRYEEGYELGPGARLIVRALKGSLVIFAKFSIYNMLPHADSAPHEGMSSDAFRGQVELLRETVEANPTVTLDYLDKLLVDGGPRFVR